jgi:hypothetical protein
MNENSHKITSDIAMMTDDSFHEGKVTEQFHGFSSIFKHFQYFFRNEIHAIMGTKTDKKKW